MLNVSGASITDRPFRSDFGGCGGRNHLQANTSVNFHFENQT
jgi:hypothetical protein